ncbi:MAG: ParB N-terminal domain-containing protein [Magnetospiraceae bacterium]
MSDAVLLIDPLDIEVLDRARPVKVERVTALAEMITADGQQDPIEVRETPDGKMPYRLVAGAHRHAACAGLGIAVRAIVYDLDDDAAALREIDENLVRFELTALERAVFVGERARIWKKMHPESKRGGDRKSAIYQAEDQSAADSFCSFTDETSVLLGRGRRTLQQSIRIFEAIPKAHRDLLWNTRLEDQHGALYDIARHPADIQKLIIDRMLREERPCASVDAALGEIQGRTKPKVDERQYQGLMDTYSRAKDPVKRRVLTTFATQGLVMLPTGEGFDALKDGDRLKFEAFLETQGYRRV